MERYYERQDILAAVKAPMQGFVFGKSPLTAREDVLARLYALRFDQLCTIFTHLHMGGIKSGLTPSWPVELTQSTFQTDSITGTRL
jgi:hypothetical protein